MLDVAVANGCHRLLHRGWQGGKRRRLQVVGRIPESLPSSTRRRWGDISSPESLPPALLQAQWQRASRASGEGQRCSRSPGVMRPHRRSEFFRTSRRRLSRTRRGLGTTSLREMRSSTATGRRWWRRRWSRTIDLGETRGERLLIATCWRWTSASTSRGQLLPDRVRSRYNLGEKTKSVKVMLRDLVHRLPPRGEVDR